MYKDNYVTYLDMITIVLVILKLANLIKLSWIWVLFPILFQLILLAIIFTIAIIKTLIKMIIDRRKQKQ